MDRCFAEARKDLGGVTPSGAVMGGFNPAQGLASSFQGRGRAAAAARRPPAMVAGLSGVELGCVVSLWVLDLSVRSKYQ
jgi:hypothetical protein